MTRMVSPILATLLAVAAPTNAAAAQPVAAMTGGDAVKLPEARAMIQIMFPAAQRQQMMDKLLSDITRPMRQSLSLDQLTDPGLKSLIEQFLDAMLDQERPLVERHVPDIVDAMAISYTHEFSLGELRDIHMFAETPAGSHYLSKSLAIVGDPAVMNVNKQIAADAQQFATQKMVELKEKVVAYLKAHPDVAAKLRAERDAPTK